MSDERKTLLQHRGDYGVDAPYVPAALGGSGLLSLVAGAILRRRGVRWPAVAVVGAGLFLLVSAGWYLLATRRGKFAIWADILTDLELRGDERVLDIGCGRGAVLLMAARLLPRGEAVGVDLWRAVDQSGNARAVTERNAELEGVADRVAIETGDMRSLPFADASFDVVLSSLALHNVPAAADRAQALGEAVRALKPGGRLRIVDFHGVGEYADVLRDLGVTDVQVRSLGWRSWYGGPWASLKLVSARKPARG